MHESNIELLIENAMYRTLAVQIFQLIVKSTDTQLKKDVFELIKKLDASKGKGLLGETK